MQKEYRAKRKTIIDALDDIDLFVDAIEKIMVAKPTLRYTYSIDITPIKEGEMKWLIDINLKRND